MQHSAMERAVSAIKKNNDRVLLVVCFSQGNHYSVYEWDDRTESVLVYWLDPDMTTRTALSPVEMKIIGHFDVTRVNDSTFKMISDVLPGKELKLKRQPDGTFVVKVLRCENLESNIHRFVHLNFVFVTTKDRVLFKRIPKVDCVELYCTLPSGRVVSDKLTSKDLNRTGFMGLWK